MRKLTISKFTTVVQSYLSRRSRLVKQQSFDTIQMFTSSLKHKETKCHKHITILLKSRILRKWLHLYRANQHERNLQAEELAAEIERLKTKKAERFYNESLLRFGFLGLIRNIFDVKQIRCIEKEHETRKNQIDSFFTNLKAKVS